MITHTKAVILKSVDYQESSKIITVLTEEHGKIALIARGAKRAKSKLSGIIEIGNILDVVYYFKPSRSVQSLTEASISYSSINFRIDFERASILYATLELVSQLVHESEENQAMFDFINKFITWLGGIEEVDISVFCYVQIRCAELCGFNLVLQDADTENSFFFDISNGSLSNEIESELSYKLTVLQSLFMKTALTSRKSKIFNLGLKGQELKQLIHHLDVYFKYHIEGYQDRRSDSIFEKMLQDLK
ncbi:MAG: DNA repair protein RecO [Balneolales bacterium]|nr:DNA repair protein RecO [Balneolales bacterium]